MCWWRFCVSVVKKSFPSVLLLRDLCVGWSVSWRFSLDVQCCSKCPLGWALKSIGCLHKMFALCGSGVFVCSIVWTQRRSLTVFNLKFRTCRNVFFNPVRCPCSGCSQTLSLHPRYPIGFPLRGCAMLRWMLHPMIGEAGWKGWAMIWHQSIYIYLRIYRYMYSFIHVLRETSPEMLV